MKTKIIATIGPACWTTPTVRKMNKSGLDIGRVNAAFVDKKELEHIKKLYHKVNPLTTLMLDTVGFKIRLDKNNTERSLKKGEHVILTSHPIKTHDLGLDYAHFERDINVGDRVFIDDGRAQLKVSSKTGHWVTATATIPCTIKKGKTVSLPDTQLSFNEPITARDRVNIQNAVALGYDYLNISFVRSLEDIRVIRSEIGDSKISLVAKIENAEGIHSIDEIIQNVDALMIPRGDLAVETPFENLPIIQKEMSIKAAQYGKPIIYASQFLDSMKSSRYPLRAEISDIGNAVFDRVDAIMLAQETAIGQYPATTVQTAQKILDRVEQSFSLDPLFTDQFVLESAGQFAKNPKTKQTLEKALQVNYQLANGYKFSCPYGLDAFKQMADFWYEYEPLVYLSKLRASLNLSIESPDARVLRQMGLLYGVTLVKK